MSGRGAGNPFVIKATINYPEEAILYPFKLYYLEFLMFKSNGNLRQQMVMVI